jgi:class 3 adenylate cyclase
MSEEEIQQMIVLATRLREQAGGELDDEALIAVSEATGAPLDYIRLAVRSVPQQMQRRTFFDQVKSSFLAFDPDVRRMVAAGVIGGAAGFAQFWMWALPGGDRSGLFSIMAFFFWLAGIYNASVSRKSQIAVASGVILGLSSQIVTSLFSVFDSLLTLEGNGGSNVFLTIACVIIGAVGGLSGFEYLRKNRKKLGLGDPAAERHVLLGQLLEIQNKLKQDEKQVTFVSVDVVGSTRIKTENDALSVEFTFNEYHKYIEQVTARFGGKIHSTAGDGVTCVFDDASSAVAAGKAMQAGLFEFNAFKNQLKTPISMRAAVHSGHVLAPGQEATAVNFAHVIDVAAHLQKVAEPGTLAVSSATAAFIGGLNAIGTERVFAENVEAAVWRPKLQLAAANLTSIVPPTPRN